MSEHLRSAEDVAREWIRDVQGEYPYTEDVDSLADLIRARDAEVREAARAEALAEVEPTLDLFATLLAHAREGLARSGSRAKGVQQVMAHLTEHAGTIHQAAEAAGRRRQRGRRHWNAPWEES